MRRAVGLSIVVGIVALGLTACDTRSCVKGHWEDLWIPVFNAATKTTTMSFQHYYVCDLREGVADDSE